MRIYIHIMSFKTTKFHEILLSGFRWVALTKKQDRRTDKLTDWLTEWLTDWRTKIDKRSQLQSAMSGTWSWCFKSSSCIFVTLRFHKHTLCADSQLVSGWPLHYTTDHVCHYDLVPRDLRHQAVLPELHASRCRCQSCLALCNM